MKKMGLEKKNFKGGGGGYIGYWDGCPEKGATLIH